MNELADFCRSLKRDFKPKITDPTKPVRFWSEKDILDGKVVDAYVMIFRTRGCSWALKSGCSMCGYFNDSIWKKISDKDLLNQFNTMMDNYSDQKFIKIFTSGSFLDNNEIKPNVRKKILEKIYEKAEKISVESRPDYVKNDTLSEIKKISKSKTFEIGIGLETADDFVRQYCINKGFTFNDYKSASHKLKKQGFQLKTYVLVKPPFITENKAIKDSINTIKKIKNITDVISLNPTNIQRNTLVDYLWYRKQYRPPWLWSIVEILKQAKKDAPDLRTKCDIAGGGSIRGAHNCKKCDKQFLDSISDYSLKQNIKIFNNLKCECYDKWQDQLSIEDLSFGSIIDI